MTFGTKATDFFLSLNPSFRLPRHFEFLQPYESEEVKRVTREFFRKFYSDNNKRILIMGINPGRFGAGVTGIAFTDPIRLRDECGIENSFLPKPELSSTFIYTMIERAGGVGKFYGNFFLTAICPIGFVMHGKNVNYYDDKSLLKSSRDFIVESIKNQIGFGAHRRVVICLGEGKNFDYLSKLNDELGLFEEIIPLAHPRFILQYRRKRIEEYLERYTEVLEHSVQKTSV